MKGCNSPGTLIRRVLRHVIAIGTGTAMLASGSTPVLAEELEDRSKTGSRIAHDTYAAPAQPLSLISGQLPGNAHSSDIAEILNDNPALFYSISSTYSIAEDVTDVNDKGNVRGSTFDLRSPGYERNLMLVDSMIDPI